MATDKKISQLSSGAPAQAGDEYVVARSGANYKLTGSNVAALVAGTANTFSATQTFSNPAEFADGSASAPAVTNTGDTDTGVYFPAANEVAVTTGGTVAAAFNSNGLFFRNRIINGSMIVWQRGTSGFTTLNNYSADRWFVSAGTSLSAVAQSSDVPSGFRFSISVAGTNVPQLVQRIESLNCVDLSGQNVTISFWAKQTSGAGASSLFLQLLHPNSADNYAAVTQIGSNQFFTGTTGWVQYSYTFTSIPAGAVNGLQVIIGANTVGAATFLVTGVQLETGSVATPFERRPYGTELMLCQRYYERLSAPYFLTVPNSTYPSFVSGIFQFIVEKRAAPTLSAISGVTLTNALDQFGIGTVTVTNPVADTISQYGCRTYYSLPSASTVGEQFNFIKTYYQASSEL